MSNSENAATPTSGAMHQIGEVAEAVGLSLRTIRHYHELELVVPSGRSAGGFRLYTDADIERVRLVKQLKPLDLSLDEIRSLLEARDSIAAGETGDREAMVERLSMYADLAAERCEGLREQLEQGEAVAQQLHREARSARRARSRG
jgi:MerR family transcriptional regulator, copper efflux regulator